MSEEKIKKILVIDALDHFVGEGKSENCIMRKIGEYIGEDDDYITIRNAVFFWDNYESKTDERINKIVKKAIINMTEFKMVEKNE